jgi:hypothetical protein
MERMSRAEARKKSPVVGPKEDFHPCHLAAEPSTKTLRIGFATSLGETSVPSLTGSFFISRCFLPGKNKVSLHATACVDPWEASIFDHSIALQLGASVSYLAP